METYTIYADRIDEVKKQLDKLAKKAARYSVPFAYSIGEEHPETVQVRDVDPVTQTIYTVNTFTVAAVDVNIECDGFIKANGWSIRARVEHGQTGKTVTVTVLENGQEYTHRMNAGTLVAVAQDKARADAPKKSEAIKAEIDAINAEYDESIQRMVYQNPEHTAENHDALWKEFWRQYGKEWTDRIKYLERDFNRELNRELKVGDGVTMHLWSDAHACTIIARTDKTLTIQRDKAILDPSFKPEWVPGGFSAICTNSEKQKWSYERDPDGEIIRCWWSEKNGCWQSGSDGSIRISRGRHEHYDHNF